MLEIERKFLVNSIDFIKESFSNNRIIQGYLNSNPERAVRIRIKDDKGYVTIKGIGNESGTSRFEWEKQIDLSDANQLIKLCEPTIIDKTRYLIKKGKHTFEVDVFHEQNEGLIVAEIELQNEEDSFEKPLWLSDEVTGQEKYYNSYLSQKPFKTW